MNIFPSFEGSFGPGEGRMDGPSGEIYLGPEGGMELRDWFAGLAMQGDITTYVEKNSSGFAKDIARIAYEFADAMMAERARRNDIADRTGFTEEAKL